ncbi:MAG: flagellar protein FlgN [Spongiibacteraceae bacterium]
MAHQSTTTHPPRIDWSPLLSSLHNADQISRQVLALLEQERQILEQRDYTAFEQLLGKKSQLLLTLQQNTGERQSWLLQQGFDDDGAALAQVEKDSPELGRMWHKLAELWRDCQHASNVNDQISQRTRNVVGRMLDVLSGNAGQGSTYNDKGATQRMQTGRTITSA